MRWLGNFILWLGDSLLRLITVVGGIIGLIFLSFFVGAIAYGVSGERYSVGVGVGVFVFIYMLLNLFRRRRLSTVVLIGRGREDR